MRIQLQFMYFYIYTKLTAVNKYTLSKHGVLSTPAVKIPQSLE